MKELDLNIFRENLRLIRGSFGFTAKELSEYAKLRNLKRVSDIEDGSGKPTMEEVYNLCVVLNVPIDNMLKKIADIKIEWK